jgi:hypothetical protein
VSQHRWRTGSAGTLTCPLESRPLPVAPSGDAVRGEPGEIVAEVATLAMNDTLAVYRSMRAPDAVLGPRVYLYRQGRPELVPLAIFDPQERKEWALRALLPVIITAGNVEVVAVVHTGRTTAPVRREASFLHVFSTDQDESWHACIYRRQDLPPRLGSWSSGGAGALSEHTIAALTRAVRASYDRLLNEQLGAGAALAAGTAGAVERRP